jgi:hypothetical protein
MPKDQKNALYRIPIIKDKMKLDIVGFKAKNIWQHYGLLVGIDPIQIDSNGIALKNANEHNLLCLIGHPKDILV